MMRSQSSMDSSVSGAAGPSDGGALHDDVDFVDAIDGVDRGGVADVELNNGVQLTGP